MQLIAPCVMLVELYCMGISRAELLYEYVSSGILVPCSVAWSEVCSTYLLKYTQITCITIYARCTSLAKSSDLYDILLCPQEV